MTPTSRPTAAPGHRVGSAARPIQATRVVLSPIRGAIRVVGTCLAGALYLLCTIAAVELMMGLVLLLARSGGFAGVWSDRIVQQCGAAGTLAIFLGGCKLLGEFWRLSGRLPAGGRPAPPARDRLWDRELDHEFAMISRPLP